MSMMPLGLLSSGEEGEIVQIRIPGALLDECCRQKEGGRLEDMGLRVGKTVQMLTNDGGPILLKIDESRLALGRGMAMKIMIRR
ncbi:MAG: ferrous iron transport protein A [Desulfuromonadales bacterium]|uniref:FeoA family protein n=1 Tax=Desulfuromonas sp. AOP6 TaxID=1566351 RepID=UPI0012729EB1|nr:FeoA family protein [Desulfuromonas sp. AOP6]BCA80856.1 iron transporter FeoA [Desulfuromonas sp. AOP6]